MADAPVATVAGTIVNEPAGRSSGGLNSIARLVVVDQKPIGRTPRSNLATYTGLFDHCVGCSRPHRRPGRGATMPGASRSTKGHCPKCEGEGFVFVEPLFLPSVYAPCPACHDSGA